MKLSITSSISKTPFSLVFVTNFSSPFKVTVTFTLLRGLLLLSTAIPYILPRAFSNLKLTSSVIFPFSTDILLILFSKYPSLVAVTV